MRLISRLLLLIYFLMPVIAGVLAVQVVAQIRDDVTPIYESASNRINSAAAILEDEVADLGSNFAPLVNAVNSLRSGLQTVLNFIRNTIYTVIDVVNDLNLACSVGGVSCIAKSINLTLPQIINLNFINTISNQITTITGEVSSVVDTTSSAINGYLSTLTLIVIIFVVWIVLGYILFFVALTRLWGRS